MNLRAALLLMPALLATNAARADTTNGPFAPRFDWSAQFFQIAERHEPPACRPGPARCPAEDPVDYWGPYINEGRTLPDFEMPGLRRADMTGDLMILHVFSAACPYSVTGQPLFAAMAGKLDIPVYGLDLFDTPEALQSMLTYGNPYRKIGTGGSTALLMKLGLHSYPQTLLLDRDYKILWRRGDALDEAMINERFLPFLEETLRARGKLTAGQSPGAR